MEIASCVLEGYNFTTDSMLFEILHCFWKEFQAKEILNWNICEEVIVIVYSA